MNALLAAALASGTLAGLDYTVLPLIVTVAAFLGIVTPPPSFAWVGEPAAVALAGALFGVGLVSAQRKRPPPLRLLERSFGLPFAAACLAAVGLSAAAQAGLGGHLLSPASRPADLLTTHQYSGSDVAVLATVGGMALPLAIFGRWTRAVGRRLSFLNPLVPKQVHAGAASIGVVAGALIARLPGSVRLGLAALSLVVLLLLGAGLLRRGRTLLIWWRASAPTNAERRAVLAELLIPGTGAIFLGRPWTGVPRLLLSIVLLSAFLLLGPLILPVYVYAGLGGALALTRLEPTPRRPVARAGVIDAEWWRTEEPLRAEAGAGRRGQDEDW